MNPIFQYGLIKGIWKNHLIKCPKCGHQNMLSKKDKKSDMTICKKCKKDIPVKN